MVARSVSVRRTKAAGINRIRKNVRALLTSTLERRTAVHRITRRAHFQVHAIAMRSPTRVCTAHGTEDAPSECAGEYRQEHGGKNMNTRVARTMLMAPVLLAALGGCVYRSKEVQTSTPSPVVMAPTPAPAPSTVVVPPATVPPSTTAAPAIASDRVVYPEGRWQLYGDGRATP